MKENSNLKDKIKLDKIFKSFANKSSDAIIILDEKGFMVYVNKEASAATGYSTQELLKLSYRDVIRLDELGKISQRFKKRMGDKKIPAHYETIIIGKDKRSIPVELSSTKVDIDNSNYIILIVHDITEEKRNKELLASEKEKAQNYLDIVEVLIIIINSDGVVTLINKKGCEILEYSKKEIIGNNWFDQFLPNDAVSRFKKIFSDLIDGKLKQNEYAEERILTKSGKEKTIAWHNTVIKDDNGKITSILSSGQDITNRKKAEEALKESEEFNKSILENSPNPKLVINLDTSINYVNPAFKKLTGFKSKEVIGIKAPYPWWIKELQDVTYQKLNEAMKNGVKKTEISFNKKNGVKLWLELTFILIKKDGETKYYLSNWVDITDRKKAEGALKESEEKYRSIFENPIIGAYKSTLDGKYIDANLALVKMLGYPSKKDLLLVDIRKDLYCSENDRPLHNKRKKSFKTYLKKKDGSKIWVEVSSKVIYDNGKPISYEGIVIDITERKKTEGKLVYLSFHDSLTGIYNRTFFSEELERLQKSRDFPISIISIDMDGLKIVNDYLGHSEGDKLLIMLTILVKKAIRKSDIFARIGGDEFALLLPKTDYDKGRDIIDRINEEIENYNYKNKSFPLIISTGLATSLSKLDSLIEINKRSDNAMYNEKNSKKQKSKEIIMNYLNKLNK